VAAACWVGAVLLTVSGAMEAGHHDFVLTQEHGALPVRLAAFLGVWVVMIGAMMLPTTVVMARLFTAVSAARPRPLPARVAFYGSYLLIWAAFALVALAGDTSVHWLVDHWAWLTEREALVLGATLVLAGAFQLSPLKDACLRACRSPMAMLMTHYRGGVRGGWTVGVRHGLNCLGCCWALMLVMFATGVGSLLWMVALTAVRVAEKVAPQGARLVRPVALLLAVAGVVVSVPALLG
jgi:predicted metal-binding membrane protein